MADNKVVNATQLDADLTLIADAIREKDGSSASLKFPSDFVSAIASIVSVPSNISALASGTITLTEQNSKLTLEHNLGVAPNFYFVRAQEAFNSTAHNSKIFTSYGADIGGNELEHLAYYTSSSGAFGTKQVAGSFWSLTDTLNTMDASGYYYKAGCIYHWICGVFKEQ